METTNSFSKTFLITYIFDPKTLSCLYKDLDDQVLEFIIQEQAKLDLQRETEKIDDGAKKITITAINDNAFFFKEGLCNCHSEHPCNFGISRVIICSINIE